MHNFLASTFLSRNFYPSSKSLPKGSLIKDKKRSSSWDQPKSSSASPMQARSAWTSTSQLSAVSVGSSNSASTSMSSDEIDCYRSMRGDSTATTASVHSAMSSDAHELADRLRSVRQAGERHKKVFDRGGQGYSILVTHEEVRVCHVDEKGEYHYRHLPIPAARGPASLRSRRSSINNKSSADSSAQPSRHGSRATSLDRNSNNNNNKKPNKPARHQVVQDRDGRTLVDITPHSVTVFHDGGVWRCHRMLGKIWDSDYATHVTARMPRPWSRRPSQDKKHRTGHVEAHSALDADELRRHGWDENAVVDDNDTDANKKDSVELLLCSNTPGERGQAPRAFKSFYHDL